MGAGNEAWLTKFALEHTGSAETAEDFELPEYRPEVRRVVGVQASVTRDNAFLDGDTAEMTGCVLYTVLYLSGDGGLASVPLFSTWTARVPLPAGEGLGVEDLLCCCTCDTVTCRVTGPRKLTLSARVRLRCTALGEVDCRTLSTLLPEAADTAGGKGEPVWRTQQSPVLRMKTCRRTGSVSGALTPEGIAGAEREDTAAPAPVQVITCGGHVTVNDVRRTSDGLAVVGEAAVQMLIQTPEGTYASCRSRVPLEDTLPCSSPIEGGREEASAWGRCASLTVHTEETGEIRWEMEYDLEGTVLCAGTSARAIDGYSPQWEDTPLFGQTDAVIGGQCVRGQITVSGEKPIRQAEGQPDGAGPRFLFGWGKGVFEKAERLPDGRVLLWGSAVCTALLSGSGDVIAEEVTLPIRYEWTCPEGEADETMDCLCTFRVWDVGGRVEGGVLRIHAEAGCEGTLFRRQSCSWLRDLQQHTDRPIPTPAPAVVIRIPDPEETLWDMQKRYRTESVEEQNSRCIIRRF